MISWIFTGLVVLTITEYLDYRYQKQHYKDFLDYFCSNWDNLDVVPFTILIVAWPVNLFLSTAKYFNRERENDRN